MTVWDLVFTAIGVYFVSCLPFYFIPYLKLTKQSFFKLQLRGSSSVYITLTSSWFVYFWLGFISVTFPLFNQVILSFVNENNLQLYYILIFFLVLLISYRNSNEYLWGKVDVDDLLNEPKKILGMVEVDNVLLRLKRKKEIPSIFAEVTEKVYTSVKKTLLIPQESLRRTFLLNSGIFYLTLFSVSILLLTASDPKQSKWILLLLIFSFLFLIFLVLIIRFKPYLGYRVHALSEMYSVSKRHSITEKNEQSSKDIDILYEYEVDYSIVRCLNLMVNGKKFKYPGNWRMYSWDLTKLIMNFSIVSTMLYRRNEDRLIFSSSGKFYLYIFFPFLIGFFSLVMTPFFQYVFFREEIGDVDKFVYFLLSLPFLVWMWVAYSDLIHYQIWHFFKHPGAKVRANIESFIFNHYTLSNTERESSSSDLVEYFMGKGANMLKILVSIFLPSYITYLSVF